MHFSVILGYGLDNALSGPGENDDSDYVVDQDQFHNNMDDTHSDWHSMRRDDEVLVPLGDIEAAFETPPKAKIV